MNPFSRIRHAHRSLSASPPSLRSIVSSFCDNPTPKETLIKSAGETLVSARQSSISNLTDAVATPRSSISSSTVFSSFRTFSGTLDNVRMGRLSGGLGTQMGCMKLKETILPPYLVSFRSLIHSDRPERTEMNRSSKPMDFVRGIIEENSKDIWAGHQFTRFGTETNADIVHIKLIRNNSFVTLTDSKGNKKAGASSGSLKGGKGGAKVSRYAAEATAEHVGRLARNLGVKSAVMKVNGFTFFKKKKQAILSFKEGFTFSRTDQNPIVYIEDTTRRPHNGCRLRKRRRV